MFLPNAAAHAAAKVAICARYGIAGLPPLDEPGAKSDWRTIFARCLAMMETADLAIVNLTPFRGASADSGTLVELGWFLGRDKPAFGYSNTAVPFADRSRAHRAHAPDPVPGLSVEGFGLVDNLMIPGAIDRTGGGAIVLPRDGQDRPFDALDVFEACVARAATALGLSPAR